MKRSPFYNSLVARYVRAGFRRGKGSFHLPGLAGILALMVVGNFGVLTFGPSIDSDLRFDDLTQFTRILFYQLIGFDAFLLIVAGPLRVHNALTREKNEGTLEFLRVSGLSPAAITAGIAFGVQVPGYLAVAVTLPVSICCAMVGGIGWDVLVYSHALLLVTATSLSMLTMSVAARLGKRTADGMIVVLYVAFLFGGVYGGALAGRSVVGTGLGFSLHPVLVFLGLTEAFDGTVIFLDTPVSGVPIAIAVHAVLGALLFAGVSRTIGAGDAYRPSLAINTGLFALAAFLLVAFIPEDDLLMHTAWQVACSPVCLFLLWSCCRGRFPSGEQHLRARHAARVARADGTVWWLRRVERILSAHPLIECAVAALPFVLAYMAARVFMEWRNDGLPDHRSVLVGLVPILGALLWAQGGELGRFPVAGTSRRSRFILAAIVPVVIGQMVASFGYENTGLHVTALSPLAPSVMTEARFGVDFDGPIVTGVAFGVAVGIAGVVQILRRCRELTSVEADMIRLAPGE